MGCKSEFSEDLGTIRRTRAQNLTMFSKKRFLDYLFWGWAVLTANILSSVNLLGDVLYLKNGDVLLVDKAWELQDEIKYQVGESVKSIAKSQVVGNQSREREAAGKSSTQVWVSA